MYLLTANPLLIALAVLPAIVLLVKVYKLDKIDKEPVSLLLSLVFLGILSTAIAQVLESVGISIIDSVFEKDTVLYNFVLYFLLVGFAEEFSKYALLKMKTWNNKNFNCRFDGVVYAVFVSLGFALWENIAYVVRYGLSVALMRAVTAVPGHACFGVFMGIWYAAARQSANYGQVNLSKKFRIRAFIMPAVIHGLYDFLTTSSKLSALWIPFVLIMFITAWKNLKNMGEADAVITEAETSDNNT